MKNMQINNTIKNWNCSEIPCARSKSNIIVTSHPYDNLVRTGCRQWPPTEIVQKLYQNTRTRGATNADEICLKSGLGFYCDLQSLHSEDAITWSIFGIAAQATQKELELWLADLVLLLDLPKVDTSTPELTLWRRIPHPDNLVPGGPEIDVTISTRNALILVEAKWNSEVGAAQGQKKDKDQIQLRCEFLKNYAPEIYPDKSEFIVLGISLSDTFVARTPEGVSFRTITWERISAISSHPNSAEIRRYYEWKVKHTK